MAKKGQPNGEGAGCWVFSEYKRSVFGIYVTTVCILAFAMSMLYVRWIL